MSKLLLIFKCFGLLTGAKYVLIKLVTQVMRFLFNVTGRKSNRLTIFLKYLATKSDEIVQAYVYQKYNPVFKKYESRKSDQYRDDSPKYIIWTAWLQGMEAMPEIIARCIKSMRDNSGEYEVKVITFENVLDYIDLPQSMLKDAREGNISAAHFTDFIRVKLLYKFGGVWFDATQYVVRTIPESVWDFDLLVWNRVYDYSDRNLYVSMPFVESFNNGFLVGKKGAIFYEFASEITELLLYDPVSKLDYFSNFMAYLKGKDEIEVIHRQWSDMVEINSGGLITRQFWNKPVTDGIKKVINNQKNFFFLMAYKLEFRGTENGSLTVQQYVLENY